jgi:pyruvate dehydrogenase (quinone)
MVGLKGIKVDHPDQVGAAWDEALAADRPVVLEAVTDPEVPPLPPHITLEQAKAMASALAKGDPGARGVIRQTLRDKVEEFLPGNR